MLSADARAALKLVVAGAVPALWRIVELGGGESQLLRSRDCWHQSHELAARALLSLERDHKVYRFGERAFERLRDLKSQWIIQRFEISAAMIRIDSLLRRLPQPQEAGEPMATLQHAGSGTATPLSREAPGSAAEDGENAIMSALYD